MNSPEKIAATYLRLNGFFLMPHFTLFDGERHTHVDFLGLRAPNSREQCGEHIFPLDENLFDTFDDISGLNSREQLLAAITEVKGGEEKEKPGAGHLAYINRFIGPNAVSLRCLFRRQRHSVSISDNVIEISLEYAFDWILRRIDWIDANQEGLAKKSSWTWSETSLSDILYIKRLGFLNVID